jgi:hypothetical protein
MAMYGLVLRSDPDAAEQVWEATENVDDLLKPEDTLVLCDTLAAGESELAARYPVPPRLEELLKNKRMCLRTVCRVGRGVVVYPRGLIDTVERCFSEVYDVSALAQGLVAVGGAVISNHPTCRYGVASGREIVAALRKDPVFVDSDLVICSKSGGGDYFDVVVDQRKAKARKTLNATRAKKNAEKAEQYKLADKASSTRTDIYVAAQTAAVSMWESFPVLKQLRPEKVRERTYYGHHDDLATFWEVVAVHETFGRKGKWRDLPEVVKLLDVFAGAGDAFDKKWTGENSYEKEKYARLSAHCARLADEVKRLARKRRREQRKSERAALAAAKEEHPEPAAV